MSLSRSSSSSSTGLQLKFFICVVPEPIPCPWLSSRQKLFGEVIFDASKVVVSPIW